MFRTPIGFHDAYVAAPSQKAALEAWGSDANLFARGSAEEVTEPELMKAPLEQPGVVFRRLRGSKSEQMEALERDARPKGEKKEGGSGIKSGMTRKRKPSRAQLAEAEEAIEALEKAQRKDAEALERKARELERERDALERRHERELKAAEKTLRDARADYEQAMEAWEEE